MSHQEEAEERDRFADDKNVAREPEIAIPRNFGRYRILQVLGQGGMGTVYLANDSVLHRHVALKVPRLKSDDEVVIHRFYREARAMASVHHASLCPIFDVGEFQGHHYFTMARLDGHPLSKILKAGVPVPEREAAAVVRRLAMAVDQLHRVGLVHHDLKPSNVMISPGGEPIVMDFGLARHTALDDHQIDSTSTILGSPAYMSPEQAAGRLEDVSPATDVYSLGVMLYELLSGRRPFQGSLISVMMQIIEQDPPPLKSDELQISDAVEAVCLKAVSKAPTDRYRNAGLLAIDLERALRQRPKSDAANQPAALSSVERSVADADSPDVDLENCGDDSELDSLVIDFLAASQSQLIDDICGSGEPTPTTRLLHRRPPTRNLAPAVSISLIVACVLGGVAVLASALSVVSHRTGEGRQAAVARAARQVSPVAVPEATLHSELSDSGAERSNGQGTKSSSAEVQPPPRELAGEERLRLSGEGLLPSHSVPTATSSGRFSIGGDAFGHAGVTNAAIADVDRDGDLDAYLAYWGDTPDEIWLNQGDGTFQDSGQRLSEHDAMCISFGDVDNDGDFDALITQRLPVRGTHQLLLNDGTGRFTEPSYVLPQTDRLYQGHLLADLDQDNDLDVVIFGGRNAVVWRNDGAGRLRATGSLIELTGTRLISHATAGDLDSDGCVDLYFSCFPGGPDQLWLGVGKCLFADSGQRLGVRGTRSTVLADIDADGDLDGFGVPLAGSPHFLWNDGAGNMDIATSPTAHFYSSFCRVFDSDGDRDLDFAFSGNLGASFLIRNEGQFESSPASIDLAGRVTPLGDGSCTTLACGDLDGDGDVDILRVTKHEPPVRIHFNLKEGEPIHGGNRLFGDKPVDLASDPTQTIVPADFDSDGDIDLLQATSMGTPDRLWLNRADGSFDEPIEIASADVAHAIAVDVDHDSDLDVIECCRTTSGRILTNDGKGHFSVRAVPEFAARLSRVCVSGASRDGLLEMTLCGYSMPTRRFRHGQDGGFVAIEREATLPPSASYVAAGDLNGDDLIDFVFAGSRQDEELCHIQLRQVDGSFVDAEPVTFEARYGFNILLGDVDADGDLDLWITKGNDQLFLNDGQGRFEDSGQKLDQVDSRCGVFGDLDADGDLDVVLANRFGNPCSIWLNDGCGQFEKDGYVSVADSPGSLALADLNGDGRLDLIVADERAGASQIWFQRELQPSRPEPAGKLAVTDASQ